MGAKASLSGDVSDKNRTKSQSGKKVILPNANIETHARKSSIDEEKDVRLYFKFL